MRCKKNKKEKKQGKSARSSFKKHPQKHEPKKIFFIAGTIFVLFLFSGCTEMTRAEKNLCYSLASRSYAFVPNCETEQSCFEKVSELFNSKLQSTGESGLYELKNRTARSWFFYNKALVEIKNISNLCREGNAGALPGAVNQARFFINQAFLELEQGMKNSFEVISIEEKYLSGQKIDLVKEEPLYDSLIEARTAISELENGATNSESYVSFYLNKIKEFNESGARFGLPQITEKEAFWLEQYDYLEGLVLKKFNIGKELWVPKISSGIRGALEYFENKFYSKQALGALEQFPAYDFMKLYSDIGGNNNSALKKFSELMNRNGKNFEAANKSAAAFWKTAQAQENICNEKLSNLKENSVFDSLAKELVEATITNKANLEEKCAAESKKLFDLREKKSRGSLTLGEELLELKSVYNSLKSINEYLTLREEDYSSKLTQACNRKAEEIKKIPLNSNNEQLTKLYNDALFFASKTSSTQGDDKLKYCTEMNEKNKLLEEARKDNSALLAKQKDSVKECFAYLEKIFDYAELNELRGAFEELKKLEVTKNNLVFFNESCESIKTQVNNELNSEVELVKAKKEFEESKNKVIELEKINSYLDDQKTAERIASFKEKILDYAKYFAGSGIDFSVALPVKEMLSNSVHDLWTEATELVVNSVISYATKNARLVYLNTAPAAANQDFNSVARLVLPNPFQDIDTRASIKTSFSIGEILRKDNCIEGVQQEKSGAIVAVKCLFAGATTMDFISIEKVSLLEEESFVFVSNKKSLIKRSIIVQSTGEIQKLVVKTKVPQNSREIAVIINGTEIESYRDETGSVLFSIEKASKETQITVFFYVENVIGLTITADEQGASCSGCLRYNVTAVNSLSKKFEAALILQIPVNDAIKQIQVFDEEMIQKDYSLIGGEIVLKNQVFLEKQTRTYKINIFVDSALKYYLEELQKQSAEFSFLGNYSKANEIEEILLDGKKNSDSAGLKKIVESNYALLEEAKRETEAQKNLELIKAQLLEKIGELRKKAAEYKSIGLEKEAKTIEDSLEKILNRGAFLNESSVAKAFDTISKIAFSADEGIRTASEKMWAEIQGLAKGKNNAALETLVDSFLNQKQIVDETLALDPLEAKQAFLEAKKDYNKIISLTGEINKEEGINNKNKLNKINLVCRENNELIDFLERQLGGREAELVRAKFIAPITQSRLQKLRLLVSEIKNSDTEYGEKNEKLMQINEELKNAVDSVKRQSISAFNLGIDSGTGKEALTTAKGLIDENNFTGAFLLLSSQEKNGNLLEKFPFMGLIPIACIVIIGFVLRQEVKKKEGENSSKKKLILDEWEGK